MDPFDGSASPSSAGTSYGGGESEATSTTTSQGEEHQSSSELSVVDETNEDSAEQQQLLFSGETWSPANYSDLMVGDQDDHVSSSSSDEFEDSDSSGHLQEQLRRMAAEELDEVAADGDKTPVEMCIKDNRPAFNTRWTAVGDLRRRELGITSPLSLKPRAIGAYQLVCRLGKERTLEYHRGCVNTLHYSECGEVLASSGDDLKIALWNWRTGKTNLTFASGHNTNVFQAKFVPGTHNGKMISTARDGQVRRFLVSPSGQVSAKKLVVHSDAAHKLAFEPNNPNTVRTCGEDAQVFEIDLRTEQASKLLRCKEGGSRVSLYSIFTNPVEPWYFAVSGVSKTVQVFDRRNIRDNEPAQRFTVKNMQRKHASVTCVVYSHDGKELLASYNEENIYVFNTALSRTMPVHSYKGHRNRQTIKGVNFFGSNSEYIVSGSDCGHVFLWEKSTEKVVQFMHADDDGAVNCLEPNPTCCALATSGLEHTIKIWSPRAKEPSSLDGLDELIHRNRTSSQTEALRFFNIIMDNRLHTMFRRRAMLDDDDGDLDDEDDDGEGDERQPIGCAQS